MKLEDATGTNIGEYSLTGRFFRVKLLSRMKCNHTYAVLAVECTPREIYKAYIWGEAAHDKKIGDIFYVKFCQQLIMDDLTRIYDYMICDEHGTVDKSETNPDIVKRFEPDYTNHFYAQKNT